MKHGIIILPQQPWAEAKHRWIQAEELGFDHAWTYDHLSWKSLADETWHATVPTLTAAASVTSRIGLGTFVASPNFRHPVTFAKELATLDDVSDGRFLLGVGSGGTGFDSTVLGLPELSPRERHARFEEFVRALDELLRFEKPGSGGVSFSGDWFTAVNARMVGTPAQTPRLPFVIAAEGPRGVRLATALADGWLTLGRTADTLDEWWQVVADISTRVDDSLAKVGRASETLDRYLNLDGAPQFSLESVDSWEDAIGRAEALGFTDVIGHWPRTEGIYAGNENVLIEIASRFTH